MTELVLGLIAAAVVAALVVAMVLDTRLGRVRLREWARREKYEVLSVHQVPFSRKSLLTGGWPVFRVTIRDSAGALRTGVIRFGPLPAGRSGDACQVEWE